VAEKTQLKAQQRDMTREEKQFYLAEEKEANEIISLRYKADTGEYRAHFKGRTMGDDQRPGKELSFLNPLWVQHHFHEKFVAMVKEYGKASERYVPVPVGSARFEFDAPPPISSVVPSVACHYPQGDKNFCMFYSFASALFFIGLEEESEQVRMAGHGLEYQDRQSQINALRQIVGSFDCFERPEVWGKKHKRFNKFSALEDISMSPTMIIPTGADGGVQHAITTVGEYIFDSTTTHAMHLTKESLDWCCNTPSGFKGIFFAIRFRYKHKD
jgi:hypothetical protein